jgi:D-alanyl-D-alanine carboxypeptidase
LLTHTSGIKNYRHKDFNQRLDYSDDDLVKQAAQFKLDFPPGEKWRYSNTGYVLLGILVNKETGKFYGDLLRERIFAPIGMESARVFTEDAIVPNRAASYRREGGQWKNQEYVSPSLNRRADGSVILTVLDLARWDAALDSNQLLNQSNLDLMWTPAKTNNGKTHPYGFGWALGGSPGHRRVSHGGHSQGFLTEIKRHIDDRLTVAVLTNREGANPAAIIKAIEPFYLAKV